MLSFKVCNQLYFECRIGGSKGIGKQLAMSLLSRGANVSIVARKESDLKAAQEELQAYADSRGQRQQVKWYSCDLTKGYEEVCVFLINNVNVCF